MARISKRQMRDALLDTDAVERAMKMVLKERPEISREELTDKIDRAAINGGMGGSAHPTTIEDLMRAELKKR